ncbi:hypothetical protein ACVWXY_001791, partial [Thermostichus sp. MS-CIW-39]
HGRHCVFKGRRLRSALSFPALKDGACRAFWSGDRLKAA